VSSANGADAAWHFRVPVKPYSKYVLSGWIKTQNVVPTTGLGALLNLHSREEKSEAVSGTSDWRQVRLEFDSGADESVQVNCLLGYYGLAKGIALFDDVKLELVSTRTPQPQVTIDASKTGEPVSKYVYGQFIEHLGRCIYGGIWSEMLEDRKLFYPVGAKESPWQTSGGVEVSQSNEKRFADRDSIKVEGSGGIIQGHLGLIAGREYVGYVWLASASSETIEVSLRWDYPVQAEQTIRIEKPSKDFKKYSFRLKSGKTTDLGFLSIVRKPSSTYFIGPVSLMPADNVRGMRADTIKLLKELNSPIYRWPGGNFVSGYDWRDGIGDRDKRPTRKNPAWEGIDTNDFGIHEFMDFCKEIGTEPLVVANAGLGDAHSAAELVEYVNGASSSQEGAKREKNGHKDPWGVKWWGIGNEMYGDWQLGHMKLSDYILKHNDFAAKMRAVDPSIKLVGVGAAGNWSEGMLRSCSGALDLLSEHFYTQERQSVPAHVAQMPNQVRRIATAHRDYRKRLESLRGKDIRIALDEWNYWYGPHLYGELGTVYFMKDALGVAAGLHEIFRNSDLYFMANYAQTVNVIGAIKTTKTKAAFDTTGLVLMKYRQSFGTIPIAMSGNTEPLDVFGALTNDRKSLTIGIVNPTGQEQTLVLEEAGVHLTRAGKRHELSGEPQAFNTPDKPHEVVWKESDEGVPGSSVMVKPYSVTILVFPLGASL
jgi:alpha-N-arabinofuranosidase